MPSKSSNTKCLRITLLSWAGLAAATVLGFVPQSALTSQIPSNLPVIEDKYQRDFIETLADGISFEMIAIPGGTYWMGSPENEKGRDRNEGPQHPVRVKPFWMGKCEVTWNEYDLYQKKTAGLQKKSNIAVQGADAVSKPSPPYHDEHFGHGGGRHPALGMTSHAAMEYCRWLPQRRARTSACRRKRNPDSRRLLCAFNVVTKDLVFAA